MALPPIFGKVSATVTRNFEMNFSFRLQRGASGHYHQNSPSKSIEHLCSKIHLHSLKKEELYEVSVVLRLSFIGLLFTDPVSVL